MADLSRHTLQQLGEADTAIAGSGDVALKIVSAWQPDLVRLDLNLPVLAGTEVCRIVGSGVATKHIPIVMLPAR